MCWNQRHWRLDLLADIRQTYRDEFWKVLNVTRDEHGLRVPQPPQGDRIFRQLGI